MRARFLQWLGASFVFAAVPFCVKALVSTSYEKFPGYFAIFGNGDLALMAGVLSSSALLDLYLIDKRGNRDKTGLFIATAFVALISMAYYGAVSKAFPNPATANDRSVAVISGGIYLLATVASWYGLNVAEETRSRSRLRRRGHDYD